MGHEDVATTTALHCTALSTNNLFNIMCFAGCYRVLNFEETSPTS